MSLDTLTSPSQAASSSGEVLPRKRSLAWLLPVGLLLGFILILALLFGERLLPAQEVKTAPVITLRLAANQTTELPTPSSVKTNGPNKEPTSGRPGRMLFQASGWVEPDPYTTYVPTLINGVVDQVHVLEGQHVKRGDLLATLVNDDAKLNLREAQIKVTSLQAQITAHCTGNDIVAAETKEAQKKISALQARLEELDDNLKRLRQLPEGAVSRQQIAQAQFAKNAQESLVDEARAKIGLLEARSKQIDSERIAMESRLSELKTAQERAQLAMDRTQIKSPLDGIVLHLHAAPGKKRMLDMDDPKSAVIVELYEPNKLQARIDVPLTEAAGLMPGQYVEMVSDLLPDAVFKGKVSRITGQADLQRNTLQAKVSIENPDSRLRPEMLLRGKFFAIQGRSSEGSSTSLPSSSGNSQRLALFVPEQALVNDSAVWVVTPDQTAELRQLQLGRESREGHRRVLDGIRSGEQVILPPHEQLSAGSRVKIISTH